MKRFFDEDRFEIYATRDIGKDEEVTHLYKSIEWRDCFKDLKAIYDAGKKKAGSSVSSSSDERELMKEYWDKDHGAPTIENMMLDSDAGSMDRLERPEILSALPSITGKRILELGAGIGRFSGVLAQKAGEVVAVDFVESSCAENRRLNAHYNNLTVLAEDVTALDVDPRSFDLVFSNWLLMYLTDDEVRDVAKRMLAALKPGGHLFFRESCYHSSGDVTRRFNPTKYRDPETYTQIFSECVLQDGSRFQLLATNCVESYAKLKGNMHQMWFRWQKVGEGQLRQSRLLSTSQYTSAHCLRYEKIYGRNYIYTGGDEISQRLLDNCKDWVKPGSRVLDIGAGLGGTVLYFAEKCPDIFLHAVCSVGDIVSFNTGRHIRREPHIRQRVTFELAPESGIPEDELKYPPNSFDLVIIRETLMYLEEQDKTILMQKVHRLLRPGGRLVVVDYCAGKPTEEMCPMFREHLQEWNYYVIAAAKQQELLERYFGVESWESTSDFVKYMDEGLRNIDTHFGPQAPERQGRTTADEVEKARDAITAAVSAGLPKLPEAAASDAAEAALSKLALHLEADAAEAKQCESDHEWATHIWNLERKAAIEGDLSWNFFVATKPLGSA